MYIDNIGNRRYYYERLFAAVADARQALRNYAESDARAALGDKFVDNTNGVLSWDVGPVYGANGHLTAVNFLGTVQGDRGAPLTTSVRVPFEDPNAPVTEDQRRALFATFTEVFGDSDRAKRLAFTQMVLGHADAEARSWSSTKPGALTVSEASRLLDALDRLNV